MPAPSSSFFLRIRSLFAWVLVGVVTVAVSLVHFLLAALLFPFDPDRKNIHLTTSLWAKSMLVVLPLMKVRIQDEAKIKPGETYIIIANHQSLADILAVLHLRHPFKFIAKKELFGIPVFGWTLSAAGYIPLIRGDRESGRQVMLKAEAYLKRKVSVLFFPEGTRSPDGEIHEFKMGAFKIASDLSFPVLPLVINGTRDVIRKGQSVFEKRSDVKVKVLNPELPSGQTDEAVEELAFRVRAKMINTLADMRHNG